MQSTPLFSFLLTMWLLLGISDSMPIVGAIIQVCYVYFLAFFTPFISRKQLVFMFAISMGRLTFEYYSKGLAHVYAILTGGGGLDGWLLLMLFWLYAYLLAWAWLRKRHIRQRVGKCFH